MNRLFDLLVGTLVLASLGAFYMAERSTETPIVAEHISIKTPRFVNPTITLPEMIIVGHIPKRNPTGAAMKGEPMDESAEWEHGLTQGGPGSVKVKGFAKGE